ncbi:MAG: hypothetical protein P8179_08950 [Candidatus Thiodiazotropha sp.]
MSDNIVNLGAAGLLEGLAASYIDRPKLLTGHRYSIGDHDYRSYFHQNQVPAIRMERSTVFLG